MKPFFILLLTAFSLSSCSQTTSKGKDKPRVGGRCEGCEAVYESPVAFEKLDFTSQLPDWNETGPKLVVTGIVYTADGKPAPGVIIYVYHTDQTGHYSGGDTGRGKRHGRLRGWMKTNDKGEYKFMTLRPAAYPGRQNPAHIHVSIKEPDKNEYWIDEYLFDDDALLTPAERTKCEDRGGSGILITSRGTDGSNISMATRNIYLGKNIPDYPGR